MDLIEKAETFMNQVESFKAETRSRQDSQEELITNLINEIFELKSKVTNMETEITVLKDKCDKLESENLQLKLKVDNSKKRDEVSEEKYLPISEVNKMFKEEFNDFEIIN